MITLYLKREVFTSGFTRGRLSTPTQKFFTMEDMVREVPGLPVCDWKVKGATAIPCGRFPLIMDMSTRFKRIMPHILSVEGFDGIRIHAGNSADDTEGCILLGWAVSPDGTTILRSRAAIEDFTREIEGFFDRNEQVEIDIA